MQSPFNKAQSVYPTLFVVDSCFLCSDVGYLSLQEENHILASPISTVQSGFVAMETYSTSSA